EEVCLGGEPGDTDDGAVDIPVERRGCVPVGTDRLGITGRALVGGPIVADILAAPKEISELALLPAARKHGVETGIAGGKIPGCGACPGRPVRRHGGVAHPLILSVLEEVREVAE